MAQGKFADDGITRVVVTLGPTDESIDDIMKITNMSTGALGTMIAQTLMARQSAEKPLALWLVCNKTAYLVNRAAIDAMREQGAQLVLLGGVKNGRRVTSETQDLLDELRALYAAQKIDYLLHSAAVGDYTGSYASSATLLADEIFAAYKKDPAAFAPGKIADVLRSPDAAFNREAKMSSDEPDMIVRLGLTPKVISHINGFAKENGYETRLISWKLLSGSSEEELYEVALAHGRRNGSYMVVGNDLSTISEGGHRAMLIKVADGSREYAGTKEEIASKLADEIGL